MAQTTEPTNHDTLLQAATAILDAPNSDIEHVVDLVAQLTQAAAAQRRVADEATARTLDPRTKSSELSAAMGEADAAKLAATRLEITAQLVEDKHHELLKRANELAWVGRYDHADAESRRVADRIKRDYPGLLAKHLDLLGDIMSVQELVWEANRNRPAGKPSINGPEGLARGFPDHGPDEGSQQSGTAIRLTQVVLADPNQSNCSAWPPVPDWKLQSEGRLMPFAWILAAWRADKERKGTR